MSDSKRSSVPRAILLVLLAVAVGLAAITRQSLWMDEGSSAFKALMPTLDDWWQMTLRIGGSDVQMPVYMFLLWVWHQLGATTEFALRAINLPWLIVAVLALGRVRFWPLVCLTSPFVLYYIGELRPYAMQMAGGAWAAAALFKVAGAREKDGTEGLHAAAGASLLLACSSLTAAVWAAGLWIGVLVIRPDWLRSGRFWLRVIPWMIVAFAMGGYYVFTLVKGYRATGLEGGGIASLFFGFYEMIGLLGLGPGRNELRASPAAVFGWLPLLVPAFLCIAGAWLCGVGTWVRSAPPRVIAGVLAAVAVPIIVLAGVGLKMDFRVLGRHLAPSIPAVLVPIAAALSAGSWKSAGRILGSLAVCFGLVSAVIMRVNERHARDDYRTASRIAIDSLKQGQRVLWKADMNATRYYAYREGGLPLINAIQVMESDQPTSMMFADVIVINRPDLRFEGLDYQEKLRRDYFELDASFTGFEVWRSE